MQRTNNKYNESKIERDRWGKDMTNLAVEKRII